MRTGILLLLAMIGFSLGFFVDEWNFPLEDHEVEEATVGNGNVLNNNLEERIGCQHVDENEGRQLKVIVRLKRMITCKYED